MVERDPWGVADGFWGTDGQWHAVSDDARRSIRSALAADDHPDGPPAGPPSWFVVAGDAAEVWSPGVLDTDEGESIDVFDRLPPDLPLGAHILRSDGGHVTQVFVVPRHAPVARRAWGWSTQLYGTRSRDSWGHGDLADLAQLTRWARASGAGLVAHNPLGAPVPTGPQEPSPYYASSRRFWSPLYLRIEDVPGAHDPAAERGGSAAASVLDVAARAGRALNARRHIDRDEVWRLKRTALEDIWTRTRASATVFDALSVASADGGLARHAVFCALAESYGPSWHDWPQAFRHPDAPAVEAFAAMNVDRIDFWRWVHHQVDVQLAAAAAGGAMLMADLPVGFDPGGSDAWCDQDLLALGCRIGAPPDDLGPEGQDWGLPPYVPWKLAQAGFAPFLDTLRRTLRSAGALRIDHVMGLFRLYWIPPGADALDGGYVYSSGTELLDLAVMEASRAGAVLVGEDLGTVEPAVRDAMIDRGVYGYRVGWFEDTVPEDWPTTTLASLTTHDLPTVRGVWSGSDAAERADAGVQPDPVEDRLMRDRLAGLAGVAPDEALSAREVTLAAYRRLAGSGSDLAVATLEDAVGVAERPNLPGTVDQHPNWRLALPVSIEDLDDAGAADLALVMGETGRAPRPDRDD